MLSHVAVGEVYMLAMEMKATKPTSAVTLILKSSKAKMDSKRRVVEVAYFYSKAVLTL
jgi:hypothetical protein